MGCGALCCATDTVISLNNPAIVAVRNTLSEISPNPQLWPN